MVMELLQRPVSVNFVRAPISAALTVTGRNAGVLIQYRQELLPDTLQVITFRATKAPLGVVLSRLLEGTGLSAVVSAANVVTIVRVDREETRQGVVMGVVRDAQTNRPIRGATVTLDKALRGVTTDEQGQFRLPSVAVGEHRIVVRSLGYTTQKKTIALADGQSLSVEFALAPTNNTLDAVVVTGTVVPTAQRAIPNAITVITARQIEERGITRIDQLFRGDVPGLFVQNQGSGNPLGKVVMYSRGATGLHDYSQNGTSAYTNPIKTYVDGVELSDPSYLSQIDPQSIERIEILTGPQASTIYGSNALNGVMQIFTKRGVTTSPQLTLKLLTGVVQNNFSSALTPQHEIGTQLSGAEGRMSYQGNAGWTYIGAWTPSAPTATLQGSGGTRLEFSTVLGRVTTDASFRRATTQNWQRGSNSQAMDALQVGGFYAIDDLALGRTAPTDNQVATQTLGLTLGYAPWSWWTHEFNVGRDYTDTERRVLASQYGNVADTLLWLNQSHNERRSLRYATTATIPVTSMARATVTVGGDGWQSVGTTLEVQTAKLTGTLGQGVDFTNVNRARSHNAGTFVQGQLAMWEQVFVTYGIRAEWNPGYGSEIRPNYAPRIGAAYATTLGPLTAKVRVSYGRSTRPPDQALKDGVRLSYYTAPPLPYFDDYYLILPNAALGPEYQQGGEGGIEVYAGSRGSLVVTRYNQTVNALIGAAYPFDSVRSLIPCPASSCYASSRDANGYGYRPELEYVNVGSIRNQGWELQSTVNTGPLTTRGTYSWTKSRTIGITPRYRSLFPASNYPEYQPGATFRYLPEHTWALGVTYAHGGGRLSLNVNGIGQLSNHQSATFYDRVSSSIRLLSDQQRVNMSAIGYKE